MIPKSGDVIALVDCNNFYASCERVFNPRLRGKPVVILSNNDGCCVAMSNEAKALGFRVGTPVFQVMNEVNRSGVEVFSSNYALYGDMSARVMEVLSGFSPDIEYYSIDESFLSIRGLSDDYTAYGRLIRDKVLRWTGIPVSVGIASTKTLSKVANRLAKKNPDYGGVADIRDRADIDSLLENTKVEDIWGIGPRKAELLIDKGINNARELRDLDDTWVRKNLGGVAGLRTVWELRGISCIPMELVRPGKKEIIASRSFGKSVETRQAMLEAVTDYTARAAFKLRRQKSLATVLRIFLLTNRFKMDEAQYYPSASLNLPEPTAYTPALAGYAAALLNRVWRPGYLYKKAGVVLSGLVDQDSYQQGLFAERGRTGKELAVMEAVDRLNTKLGRNKVRIAAQGFRQEWGMRRERLSGRFTTRWDEVLSVRS